MEYLARALCSAPRRIPSSCASAPSAVPFARRAFGSGALAARAGLPSAGSPRASGLPVVVVFPRGAASSSLSRAAAARTFSSGPAARADRQLLDMMVASAHWKLANGFLTKSYEFRDDKTAKLFAMRASDLWPKLCCPPQELALAGAGVAAVIKDASALGEETGEGAAFAREPSAVEVDIALALDDCAAERQLGGRWN